MSVTFHIIGERHAESGEFALNVSNTNAYAFLAWLGLPNHDPAGSIGAGDLAAPMPADTDRRRRIRRRRAPRRTMVNPESVNPESVNPESAPVGALGHLRVLDLADEKGAYAAKLLADLGADTIKIESPHEPDPVRGRGPVPSLNEAVVTQPLPTSTCAATLSAPKP